jgi:hypothetical protein
LGEQSLVESAEAVWRTVESFIAEAGLNPVFELTQIGH